MFTFKESRNAVKVITTGFFSLLVVSGICLLEVPRTKCYDLLPSYFLPDIICPFLSFIKWCAIAILLLIPFRIGFPFDAIEALDSLVRNRLTRNKLEYSGFTLVLRDSMEGALPEKDINLYFRLSCNREVPSKPSSEFTIQSLMKQIPCQQMPVFDLSMKGKEYFPFLTMYFFKLGQFLKSGSSRHPCHAAYLAMMSRPSEYRFQHEVNPEQSPFQLLFSCLERGLALTQNQYERSELGEPALDRDLALLRAFLSRALEFHWLAWREPEDLYLLHHSLSYTVQVSRRTANRLYAELCKVSLDLGVHHSTPWLRRAIEALFDMEGRLLQLTYREGDTEYAIYRLLGMLER